MPGTGSSATSRNCATSGTWRRPSCGADDFWRRTLFCDLCLNDGACTAVDVDGDAADEGAGVGAREAGHARELLGLAHAVEELLVGLASACRALVTARPLIALDQADQHGIHQHAVRRVLLGKRLGE